MSSTFRSIQSYSFLRRGATVNSRDRKKPHMNLWCPTRAISNPSTPTTQHPKHSQQLARSYRSDYSVTSTPKLSRCLSECGNFAMEENPRFLISPPTPPPNSNSSPLMVPQESHCTRKDPPKSSWGTTLTTIQATRRFSHQRATTGAITVNGDPERSCISMPPSPRFSQRDATMLH